MGQPTEQAGTLDEIGQELNTLSTFELLVLLDNIQAQVMNILIERTEALEMTPEERH